ncbi:MAG: radical SAM protein [Chloroflexota bacterium]
MHPPLLLSYAAAFLRSRGHEVRLLDAQADPHTVPQFLAAVKEWSPDFVVFDTSTPSFSNDARVAAELKRAVPCRIVFVGPHVSALPVESMRTEPLDAVVVGEYELSLAEYVEKGGDGTLGICYRKNGEVVLNPGRPYIEDLDSLPFPARDLMHNERYFDPLLIHPFTFVLGGRGCPYRCTFCNWPQVMTGRTYRVRSARNIADELEMLDRTYGFKSYLFNDDTFTANRKHAISVAEEVIARGLRLEWGCYSRADNTDREMLEKLRDAGCFLLKVGVESGNQEILDRSKKGYKLERVTQGVKLMKELGFNVHCTFALGLPGETRKTIEETIAFAIKLAPTTVQFSTVVPFPKTELYDYLKANGCLATEDWDQYMPVYPIIQYPDLSAQELVGAVRRAYRKYYFRPAYVKVGLREVWRRPATVWANFRKLVKLSF